MKHLFLAITATVALSACAGTRVTKTDYSSGALEPKKIYIRHFETAEYTGYHGGKAMKAIRESQGGRVFADILKEELEKLAPTTVLKPGERPDGGWLVTGSLEVVDGGSSAGRAVPGLGNLGLGRSGILVHVRVTDADGSGGYDAKGASSDTLYDFEVAGGSRLTGKLGGVMAPGLGYSAPFDYRNAAERIGKVLNPDLERYGARAGSSIR